LVPTLGALLTGVPGINFDHSHPTRLGFICQEAVELSKRPGMHTPLGFSILSTFASANFRGLSNVGQVLKNEGSAWGCILNNALGEDMIMVSSLPKQFSRKLFQVPFSRLGSFGLQLASNAMHATFLLFPPSVTQELTIGGNRRPIQAKVNSNHLFRRCDVRSRNGYNDMKVVAPVVKAQVRRTRLSFGVLESMLWDGKTNLKSPLNSRKASGCDLPLDPIGSSIVPDRRRCGLWTTDVLKLGSWPSLLLSFGYQLRIGCRVLLLPSESRFHGLGCRDAGSTHQLSREFWESSTQWVVRRFVQLYPVAIPVLKSLPTNGIETLSVFLHRSIKNGFLFLCRIQLYHNCSIHTKSISYIRRFVKRQMKSSLRAVSFLPILQGNGSPERTHYEGKGNTMSGFKFINELERIPVDARVGCYRVFKDGECIHDEYH
jgi:hypothetical protein